MKQYLGFQSKDIDLNSIKFNLQVNKEFETVRNTKFKDVTSFKSKSGYYKINIPYTSVTFKFKCKKKKVKKYFKQCRKAFKLI